MGSTFDRESSVGDEMDLGFGVLKGNTFNSAAAFNRITSRLFSYRISPVQYKFEKHIHCASGHSRILMIEAPPFREWVNRNS